MRVVVTGGTGLIGHQLVMSLGQDGHEVVIVSRSPRQAGPMPETISFVQWDGITANGWGHVVDGADAVVNLAGASIGGDGFLPSRWTRERKQLIVESRVNAGKAVTAAIEAAKVKPRVLIQSSAVGYYGTHGSEDITEAHPAGDDFLANVCKQWEASTAAVENMGVRRVIIRSGVVLSTEGGALPRLSMPFKFFAGGPLGSGKQQLPWIHMADEIGAIRFLIEHSGAAGPYNLSAPNPLSNKAFAQVLGEVLNRPALLPTPGFAFTLAFGEVATLVLDGQRAVPKRLLEAGYVFQFADAKAALMDLFRPKRAVAAA